MLQLQQCVLYATRRRGVQPPAGVDDPSVRPGSGPCRPRGYNIPFENYSKNQIRLTRRRGMQAPAGVDASIIDGAFR